MCIFIFYSKKIVHIRMEVIIFIAMFFFVYIFLYNLLSIRSARINTRMTRKKYNNNTLIAQVF